MSIFGRGSILGLVLSLIRLGSNILGLGSILGLGGVFCLSSILSLERSIDFLPLPLVLGLLSPLPLVADVGRVLWDLKRGRKGFGGKGLLY